MEIKKRQSKQSPRWNGNFLNKKVLMELLNFKLVIDVENKMNYAVSFHAHTEFNYVGFKVNH